MKKIRHNKTGFNFNQGFTLIELIISMTWFLILFYLSISITTSYFKLLKNIDNIGKSLVLTDNILEEYFHRPYAEINGEKFTLLEDVELIEEIELIDSEVYQITNCEKTFKQIKLSLRVKDNHILILYTLKSP